MWPSTSEPHVGGFVRHQVLATRGRVRFVVLTPRLIAQSLHALRWGRRGVSGWQQGYKPPPPPHRLLRYPMLRLPRMGEAEVRAVGARLALKRAGERPAVVHGHFLYEIGVAAVRLARSLGVPSVVTVHGSDGWWLVEGTIHERFRRKMLAAATAVDRLVVVEHGLAERLIEMGVPRERVVIVPDPVDAETFRLRPRVEARRELGLDDEAGVIVFVGGSTAGKGIEVLERALRRLDRSVRCFSIGPRGEPREGIEQLGVLPAGSVATWLASADVFCLPSVSEGMPVSVGEALACGRPIVATAVGGIPEQVEDGRNGFLVPPEDDAALAEALRAALTRSWDPGELRTSSRRFWSTTHEPRLTALYEELAAAPQRAQARR
jgi:glycosyltransferase involved in cell wall biosynthesis